MEIILYIVYISIIIALELKLNEYKLNDKVTMIGYCIAQVMILILLLLSVYIIPYLLTLTTQ